MRGLMDHNYFFIMSPCPHHHHERFSTSSIYLVEVHYICISSTRNPISQNEYSWMNIHTVLELFQSQGCSLCLASDLNNINMKEEPSVLTSCHLCVIYWDTLRQEPPWRFYFRSKAMDVGQSFSRGCLYRHVVRRINS